MSNRQKFYINGEWVAPSTTDTLDVINPATEQPIDKIAMGAQADVDAAVAAAKNAFESFSQTTREERVALMENIIAKYAARMDDVAATISEEMGAPAGLARAAQAPSGIGAVDGGYNRFARAVHGGHNFVESRTFRLPTKLRNVRACDESPTCASEHNRLYRVVAQRLGKAVMQTLANPR